MARKYALRLMIDHYEAAHLIEAFDALPLALQESVQGTSELIAGTEALKLRLAAMKDSRQAALVAPSIEAKRGDFPMIIAGGRGRIPGRGKTRWSDILFGAEFGGQTRRTTMQFRPHTERRGYWLYPTLWANMDSIIATYEVAVQDAQKRVGLGDTQ